MRLKPMNEVLIHLDIIANHITDYIYNKGSLNKSLISKQLNSITTDNTIFNINIINVNPKDKPFIMAIHPDAETLELMATPLVNAINSDDFNAFQEQWKNGIKKWFIEIDNRVITRYNELCVDNGRQFVAMLCHEIGHVMDTHPLKLTANYKMAKARIGMYQKMLSKKSVVTPLFVPMFVCVHGLRVIVNSPSNKLKEISADSHIPMEYRQDFVDYIEHHILTNARTASGIVVTEKEFDDEQNSGIMFTSECIRLMKHRRNVVKTQLNIHYKLQNSLYFKTICKGVIKRISGDDVDTGKVDLVKESYVASRVELQCEEAVKESEIALGVLESKVTAREIMLVAADANNIRTVEDKTYVINNIFDYIEALQKEKRGIIKKLSKKDPATVDLATKHLDTQIDQLNEILTGVINTKVDYYRNNHYGVFVQYPDGYEG